METMTVDGTEKRVDELAKRMDFGFEQTNERLGRVEQDIREVRGEVKDVGIAMKNGFDAMDAKWDAKFDRLNRTIVYLLGGSLSVLTAGLLAASVHALF
jgi:uncharacterized protein (UPF0335 family)